VPDLGGFAAANDLVGKSDVEVREAIGDKFLKDILFASEPSPRTDAHRLPIGFLGGCQMLTELGSAKRFGAFDRRRAGHRRSLLTALSCIPPMLAASNAGSEILDLGAFPGMWRAKRINRPSTIFLMSNQGTNADD
jgi:hypothetical protein